MNVLKSSEIFADSETSPQDSQWTSTQTSWLHFDADIPRPSRLFLAYRAPLLFAVHVVSIKVMYILRVFQKTSTDVLQPINFFNLKDQLMPQENVKRKIDINISDLRSI